MSSLRPGCRGLRAGAAGLLAVLAAGCARPLAGQHEFFSPLHPASARAAAQARHEVSHHRALQAVQRACRTGARPADTPSPAGPDLGAASADAALAEACAVAEPGSVAARGGASRAYRRWEEGPVRELPSAAETAASAASGS